jgi:hypothetical protein
MTTGDDRREGVMDSSDNPFYSPTYKPPPARVAKPGEFLFEFLRASDHAPMSCELRFNGESYGWEAQFLKRGELVISRGGFVTKKLAVQRAELERAAMETG